MPTKHIQLKIRAGREHFFNLKDPKDRRRAQIIKDLVDYNDVFFNTKRRYFSVHSYFCFSCARTHTHLQILELVFNARCYQQEILILMLFIMFINQFYFFINFFEFFFYQLYK